MAEKPRWLKDWPDPPEYIEPARGANGVPLAVGERKKPWYKTEVLTLGETALDLLDPSRTTLTEEQHIALCNMKDDKGAISALLKANLDRLLDPDLLGAQAVLGNLGAHNLHPGRIVLSIRFYTLAVAMRNVDYARTLLDDKKKVSIKDRLEAQKQMNKATEELSYITNIIEKLVIKLKMLDDPKPEAAVEPTPSAPSVGVAPDLE